MNFRKRFTQSDALSSSKWPQRSSSAKRSQYIHCESGVFAASTARKSIFKLLLTGLFFFAVIPSNAQNQSPVQVHILIHPPYSPYLDQTIKQAIITITNTSQRDITLAFKGKISNGSKFIQTKAGVYSQHVTVAGGHSKTLSNISFNYGSFLGPRVIDDNLTNAEVNAIYGSRILPEGTYTYCLSAFAVVGSEYIPIQQAGTLCASFSVFFAQPPIITSPIDKAQINQQASPIINFAWTPPAHTTPGSNIQYDLYLIKVNDGDDPKADMQNAFTYHSNYYIKIPGIKTNNYIFNTKLNSFKIDSGQQYAVMVQAEDASGKSFFVNDGKSEVVTFNTRAESNGSGSLIIPPGGFESTSLPVSGSSCSTDVFRGNAKDIDLSGSELLNQYPTITIGKFILTLDKGVKRNSDGSYAGMGYVTWSPYGHPIKLKVSFNNLKVNTDGVVYSGVVVTSMDGSFTKWAPLTSADNLADEAATLTGLKIKNSDYTNLENHINEGAHLVNQITGNDPIDMPLGLNNTSLAGIPSTLAIMGITFTPSGSNMALLYNMNIPEANGWLSLAGTCFPIKPQGFSLDDGVLYLPNDRDFTIGATKFTFKGCAFGSVTVDTTKGTYVQLEDGGFKDMVAEIKIALPQDAIVPVNSSDQLMTGQEILTSKLTFTSWNDWIATASLDHPFEIKGLRGFSINTPAASGSAGLFYDHSAKRNPAGISFPKGYKGSKNGTFMGLYIPDLQMTLPPDFKTFTGSGHAAFNFNNFILDSYGVTTQIDGTKLIDLSTGDLGGWAFSIDHFHIGIVQNNIDKNGMKMDGQIRLPVSNTDALDYTCNLNSGAGGGINYQFRVTPKNGYDVDIWKATFTLDPTTNLIIQKDKLGMAISSNIDGRVSFDIGSESSDIPEINLTALSFQGMKLTNRKGSEEAKNLEDKFVFDPGHWNLGSGSSPAKSAFSIPDNLPKEPLLAGPHPPENIGQYAVANDKPSKKQSKVAGFDVTLSNFKPVFAANSLHEYKLGVSFDLKLNIGFGDASIISGTTNLAIVGNVKVSTTSAPTAAFDKVDIDSIALHGDVGPVTVDGALAFRNNDPTYGNGIAGSLSATIKPLVKLCAAAQFGTAPKGFHYWGIGGSVYMKNTVFYIGPFGINGFGGGVGYNMSLTLPSKNAFNKATASNSSGGGASTKGCAVTDVKMTPEKGSVTFSAGIYASMIRPEMINAALTLSASLNNGGLTGMELKGTAAIISADPPANGNAMLKVDPLKITYDFKTNTFDAHAKIGFQFLTAQAHAPIWIHGGSDGDWLYVGQPDKSRVTLTLISIGAKDDDHLKEDGGGPLFVYLGANAYFDASTSAKGLPQFPPLPAKVNNFLYGEHSNMNGQSRDNSNTQTLTYLSQAGNAGFMFGAEAEGDFRLTLLFLKASANAIIGFDMALLQLPPGACGGSGGVGIDGWYGLGQLYAYLHLGISIHVDVWFIEGDFTLAEFDAGAALQAGLVKPTWVYGMVKIHGNVLNNLITINTSFPFSFGNRCTPPYNPLDKIKMITEAGPKDPAGVFDVPYVVYSLPMNGSKVTITVPPDKNHSGSFERTFRFYEDKFELSQAGSDVSIPGTEQMNSNGLASAYYYFTMLKPHTKYKLYVKCHAQEITGGGYNESKRQDTTIYFTTGDAPKYIVPKNIVYTYPIKGQQHLLKNEFGGQGHIKLGVWQSNILPVNLSKYDYILKFIPENGGDTVTTSFVPNNNPQFNSLDFHIPSALKNSTTYRMEAWIKPHTYLKAKLNNIGVNKQFENVIAKGTYTQIQRNKKGQITKKQKTVSGSVNVRTYHLAGNLQSKASAPKPLFTLRFRTSKYNSFADKIKSYGKWKAQKEDNNHNIELIATGGGAAQENFDQFEIKGWSSTYNTNLSSKAKIDAHYAHNYPPLFSAEIPWNKSGGQNDKYAQLNIYNNAYILILHHLEVKLGAYEVRKFFLHPEYTLTTALMPYDTKLEPPKKFNYDFTTASEVDTYGSMGMNITEGVNKVVTESDNYDNEGTQYMAQSPYTFSANQADFVLPASYYANNAPSGSHNQKGSQQSNFYATKSNTPSLGTNTAMNFTSLVMAPRLLWKRDEYIYADYHLLHRFGFNYQLTKDVIEADQSIIQMDENLKKQLIKNFDPDETSYNELFSVLKEIKNRESDTQKDLLHIESMPIATGTYGSISIDPEYFDYVWTDSKVMEIAKKLDNLQFKPFQPTTDRMITFKYRYPFSNNFIGSTVPETFNYQMTSIDFNPGLLLHQFNYNYK